MSDTDKRLPYETLGTRLKSFREHNRESLAEVCGAVEIDEKELNRFEAGQDRPSEDILLLLISHFGIRDDKAAELWQLAGYDRSQDDDRAEPSGRSSTLMVMIDPRVMYSDAVEVIANKQGVVVNFSQTSAGGNQPLTVSRIGMSYHQAKMVMGLLHQALYDHDNPQNPRQLGGGNTDS